MGTKDVVHVVHVVGIAQRRRQNLCLLRGATVAEAEAKGTEAIDLYCSMACSLMAETILGGPVPAQVTCKSTLYEKDGRWRWLREYEVAA